MFCKNCGNETDTNFPYCKGCGFHPLTEKNYCQYCGTATKERQVICISCGQSLFAKELQVQQEVKQEQAFRELFDAEIQFLSTYYQRQFTEIYESGEGYKGKWNWSAFFFGWLWALTKGCWLSSIIHLIICFFSFGLAVPVMAVIWGVRGNWVFYNRFVKNKQLAL